MAVTTAMTTSVPYEKNRIVPALPLFVITRKKKEGEKVTHVEECPSSYIENLHYLPPEYVSAVVDIQTGTTINVYDITGNNLIRYLYKEHVGSELNYEIRRDFEFLTKSKEILYHEAEMLDDILFFREFRFHAFRFYEGKPQCFYETKRHCFRGDECWTEFPNGTVKKMSLYYLGNARKINSDFVFDNLSIAEKKELQKTYPFFRQGYWSIVSFAYKYMQSVRTRRIYDNVPECIRNFMESDYGKSKKDAVGFMADENGQYVMFSDFNQSNDAECCVWFSKDKVYRFAWNPYAQKWVSTTRRKEALFTLCKFDVDEIYETLGVEKTGTLLDKMRGIKYVNINTVDYMHRYPIFEKLKKAGFSILVDDAVAGNFYNHNDVFGIVPVTNEQKNCSLAEFFGVTNGMVKFIDQKINAYQVKTQRDMLSSEAFIKAVPDPMDRVLFLRFMFSNYRCEQYIDTIDMNDIASAIPKLKYAVKLAKAENMYAYLNNTDQKNSDNTVSEWVYDFVGSKDDISKSQCRWYYSTYIDYIRSLEKAKMYNEILTGMGLPEEYYPEFPKLSSLKHYHDIATRNAQRYDNIEGSKKKEMINSKILELSTDQSYTEYLFENSDYVLLPVKSSRDLIYEGEYLHHCVGTYTERVANRRSFIYMLRKKAKINVPFFTIEVIPKARKKAFINQCYTFHDTIEKPQSCKKFIQEWAALKGLDIACSI